VVVVAEVDVIDVVVGIAGVDVMDVDDEVVETDVVVVVMTGVRSTR